MNEQEGLVLEHLSFKGEWREYQKRILEKATILRRMVIFT